MKEITHALKHSFGSRIGLLGAFRGCYNEEASAIALFQNSQSLLLHDAQTNIKQAYLIVGRCIVAPDPTSTRTFLGFFTGRHCVDLAVHEWLMCLVVDWKG